MSFSTSRVAQPPWTSSATLGGDFVYLPQTDEIALKNGERYARPRHVPAKSLDGARYDGPLPSKPGDGPEPSQPRQATTVACLPE
jgi:hypothetical protein